MASPLDAVRRLSAATVNLLLSRAEFASLELAQTRVQLIRWVALALFAMVLVLLALIAGSALVTVALWPRYGWITLAVLFALYGVSAVLVFRKLTGEISAAPPVLSATLRELSNDRDALLADKRVQAGDGGEV
ncbi:MAG: hypothetical protein HOP03_02715 [Lysobacter sp.]|nr:hypothetical protein [Lysobacter sp.]